MNFRLCFPAIGHTVTAYKKSPKAKAEAWYLLHTHTHHSQIMPLFTFLVNFSLYSKKRLCDLWQYWFGLLLLQKLTNHVTLHQTPPLAAIHIVHAYSLPELWIEDGGWGSSRST